MGDDDRFKSTLNYPRRAGVPLATAFADHLAKGQLFDAALAARAMGRPTEAAALFDQANHHAEAAACWQEAGDMRRALASAEQVPPAHALYKSCVRLAIDAAAALNQVNPEFDSFVAPWVKRGPKDTYDSEILLDLADLYRSIGRSDDARSIYQRLLRSTVQGQARARLDELQFGPRKAPEPVPAPRKPAPRDEAADLPLIDSSQLGLSALGPGSTVAGRYRLEEPLGHGGTSTVFRATDLALDEQVALKLLSGSSDPEQKARFRREINLARKLAHDNILRIYELVLAHSILGITMELVDGLTLDAWVDEQRASLAERRDLLVQAARGIGYAHRHGVVHRDIKPSNLMVRRDGVLKVSDFGIAKLHEEQSITASGSFHGTPYYVSPEQITNFKNVDHRADVYSLGVVAYELFTGAVPFDGRTVVQILVHHTKTVPVRPCDAAPHLPKELDALLMALLEKAPDARPQSCDELADRLAAIRF